MSNDISFADQFFGTTADPILGEPVMRINGEVVKPYRHGDMVLVEQGGQTYRVLSRHGYWNNSVCQIVPFQEQP